MAEHTAYPKQRSLAFYGVVPRVQFVKASRVKS